MARKSVEAGSARCADRTSQRDVPAAENSLARRTGKGRGGCDGGRLQRPLLDTRVVYCGDNLEQPAKRPDAWTRTK